MMTFIWISFILELVALIALLLAREKKFPKQNVSSIEQKKDPNYRRRYFTYGMVVCGVLMLFNILLIPIGIYVGKFGNNKLSTSTADWGTFGDYVGGILNPAIALLTLVLTVIIALMLQAIERRNRDNDLRANVKPELVTDLQKIFHGDSILRNGMPYPEEFSYVNLRRAKSKDFQNYTPFYIAIYNIGHRTAKNVEFNFSLDFASVTSVLTLLASNYEYEGEIKVSEVPNNRLYGKLEFNSSIEIEPIPLINENREEVSYILSVDISQQPFSLIVPLQFLDLYKLFSFLNYFQKKENRKEVSFPPIDLAISYEDIYGNEKRKKFQVFLEYWMGYEYTTHQLTIKSI